MSPRGAGGDTGEDGRDDAGEVRAPSRATGSIHHPHGILGGIRQVTITTYLLVGQRKDSIGQPATEGLIIAELLEQLRVILEQRGHHA